MMETLAANVTVVVATTNTSSSSSSESTQKLNEDDAIKARQSPTPSSLAHQEASAGKNLINFQLVSLLSKIHFRLFSNPLINSKAFLNVGYLVMSKQRS